MDTRPIDIAKLPSRRTMVGTGVFAEDRKLRRAVSEPGGRTMVAGSPWENAQAAMPIRGRGETLPAKAAKVECHADV